MRTLRYSGRVRRAREVRRAPLEDEPARVDVVHPGDLDRHAVVDVVTVVQDDEGIGAIGAELLTLEHNTAAAERIGKNYTRFVRVYQDAESTVSA